jgi:GNAT superfamily N-acetyltransferase
MAEQLESAKLKTGETMDLLRVPAPCGEWAERIVSFMYLKHPEYTNCSWHRNCERVVAGQFADVSHDVFFLGLLDGEIVGSTWYGAPQDTMDLATFGRVITVAEQRRKGISTILCRAALEDFRSRGGWCMHLGTGRTNPARLIYESLGFVHCNYVENGGTVMRAVLRGEEETFEEEYFQPGRATTLRPLHYGDLARAELLYNLPHWFLKDYSLGVYANTPFEGRFFDIMTGLERQAARGAALVTDEGRMTGLAYTARTGAGAGAQEHLRVLEFLAHPNYAEQSPDLISAAASGCEVEKLLAYSSALDVARSEALQEAGFEKEATLADCLQDELSEFDLYVYALSR